MSSPYAPAPSAPSAPYNPATPYSAAPYGSTPGAPAAPYGSTPGAPAAPYGSTPGAPYGAPVAPYGASAAPYGSTSTAPAAPYGAPAAPYGAPAAPYGAPGAPYGAPGAPYGAPGPAYAGAPAASGGAGVAPPGPWQPPPQAGGPMEGFDKGDQDAPEEEQDKFLLPDSSLVKPLPGYEGIGWNPELVSSGPNAPPAPPPQAYIPPPPRYDQAIQGERPPEEYKGSQTFRDEEVREALLEYVSQHCCFGKSAARDMTFKALQPFNALHYVLETFTEQRMSAYTVEPYRGQFVDGPERGMPPGPWDMPCAPQQGFQNEVHKLEVPHTTTVMPCSTCARLGHVMCRSCHGFGNKRCVMCHGRGVSGMSDNRHSCYSCHGRGRKMCHKCNGNGRVTCPLCQGFCSVKSFVQLTVNYFNHKDDYIYECTDLPDELISTVTGQTVLAHTASRVWPLQNYPISTINEQSVQLVEKHAKAWPEARIIQQRHTLTSVPVCEVSAKYKSDSTKFWVYGDEKKIHYPDYPQQCCWGCSVMQKLSEDDVRDALTEFVNDHCCYGKSPAQKIEIESIEPSTGLRYILETFIEQRSAAYTVKPYTGQYIDYPENGVPPQPWDIQFKPKEMFKDDKDNLAVPHTASVIPCSNCNIRGHVRCTTCHGWGERKCKSCHGSGQTGPTNNRQNCSNCHGNKTKMCECCHGIGRTTCPLCEGYCRLKSYVQLTVSYCNKNNKDDPYIDESTKLPDKLIKTVKGQTLLTQTASRVSPLQNYPKDNINKHSAQLVKNHAKEWPTARIIKQRHTLTAVPVCEVSAEYKGDSTKFWVYGNENKIHFPDYPQQRCCGCSVM